MLEAQTGHRLPEPFRFGGVEGANALVEIDVAVGAGAGAAGAHDQEGGGAPCEALADVGATGFLADGVQLQIDQHVGHSANALPLRRLDTQPVGFLQGGHLLKSRYRDVAQLGSALRSGRRGRRFESCHPDCTIQVTVQRQLSSAPG